MTRHQKWRAELRAKYAPAGKFPHKCKACGEWFYTYRPDAQTCSQRCRKAYSRSPAGALARLKRLGRSLDEYKTDREWAAQKHARDKAWRQIMEDSRSGLKLKQARVPSQSNRGTLSI